MLTEVAKATTATCVFFSIWSALFMVQTSKSCNMDIAIGSIPVLARLSILLLCTSLLCIKSQVLLLKVLPLWTPHPACALLSFCFWLRHWQDSQIIRTLYNTPIFKWTITHV